MGATLQTKGVAAGFGDRELFSGLDLVVGPGEVVGLVGPNGAGKSTLLKILAGVTRPTAGEVSRSPASAAVGHLTQQVDLTPNETPHAYLERRTGVADAHARLDAASHALARGEAGADDGYALALEAWLALGGADLDDRIEAVARDLDLTDLFDSAWQLSGGQLARLRLAALLLSRYDAYLLDEPTNDLDSDGLDRLEEFVHRLTEPAVVVSHDREFLSRTVTSVIEIDQTLQRVAVYGGSYDSYLDERSLARRRAREAYEGYAQRRGDLEQRARRQRAWMEKGVKNARRKARDNDKIGRKFRSEASEKQAAKARQTQRLIERLDAVDEPRKEWQLQFSIASAPRSGAGVATARGATVHFEDFRLGPIDLALGRRDRVAITGPNGAGKSTMLRLLLRRIEPESGTVTLGSGVVVGEVDQARAVFEGGDPLLESFSREMPSWPTADVRTLLAKFGLGADHVVRDASSLSPGERTRAALALLQARGVNLLVLDEPTNHLDLPAIEQLEEALEAYDGTLLLVTHDRRMLETVRLTRRWHVEAGVVVEVPPD